MLTASIMLLQILAAWPAPASPQWTMRLPMHSRIGLALSKAALVAAGHEGQSRRLRAGDAARHRRIEREHLGRARELVSRARRGHVDGRGVDHQRAGCRRLEDAPAPHRQRVLAGRQHGDDGIDAAGGIGRRCNFFDAPGCGLLQVARHEVEAPDLMSLLHEVAGHGRAHVAQSDEAYRGHVSVSSGVPTLSPCEEEWGEERCPSYYQEQGGRAAESRRRKGLRRDRQRENPLFTLRVETLLGPPRTMRWRHEGDRDFCWHCLPQPSSATTNISTAAQPATP